MRNLLLLFTALTLLSACSKDDDNNTDPVTSIKMIVDGQPQTFEFSGRGITLDFDGSYELDLSYFSSVGGSKSLQLLMRYKKKGKNVFEYFAYDINGNSYVPATGFVSQVTRNSSKQFTATFSGPMQSGEETITVTEGYINNVYDEPFD